MKYLQMPCAIGLCFVLVVIYFAAGIFSALFNLLAMPFEWVMSQTNQVIESLEKWGDTL